jgi:hypothetical protein
VVGDCYVVASDERDVESDKRGHLIGPELRLSALPPCIRARDSVGFALVMDLTNRRLARSSMKVRRSR